MSFSLADLVPGQEAGNAVHVQETDGDDHAPVIGEGEGQVPTLIHDVSLHQMRGRVETENMRRKRPMKLLLQEVPNMRSRRSSSSRHRRKKRESHPQRKNLVLRSDGFEMLFD